MSEMLTHYLSNTGNKAGNEKGKKTYFKRAAPKLLAPATLAVRPERPEHLPGGLEQFAWKLAGRISKPFRTQLSPYKRFVQAVLKFDDELQKINDSALRRRAQALRLPLREYGFEEKLIAEAFALAREAGWRALGMRHFPSQIIGSRIMLAGKIAEMQTGEGKTLTATLAASTAALAGMPVHVMSVNDYLTERDAAEMKPLYHLLGLSVGCIVHEVPHQQRQAEYAKDITYCTNNELTFDYLRDRMVLQDRESNIDLQSESLYRQEVASQQLLLRGLHFAIMDEADSLLIDDARTPLVISGSSGGEQEIEFYQQAYALSQKLKEGEHFKIDFKHRFLQLNDEGKQLVADRVANYGPLWKGKIRREEIATQALTARYLFIRDEHYVVKDEKVQIIDENTGRVMADRSWEKGLHQLIEIKEGCELTPQRETLAKISYQRFFRRYLHLSGMTGTASEVANELWDVYGLSVVKVPTHKPSLRKPRAAQVFRTEAQKWQAVLEEIKSINATGQPLLVTTKTVGMSEALAERLEREGIVFQLLNAKEDSEEANIIAGAGQLHQITIVTNIAGRGTDIKLSREAKKAGGLHVVLTDLFEAKRIDRQIIGRCARQGDPGSYRSLLSMDTMPIESPSLTVLRRLSEWGLVSNFPGVNFIARYTLRRAQRKVEKIHFRMRKNMLRQYEIGGDKLNFVSRYE